MLKQEDVIIAEAINTVILGVELSGMGKIAQKIDETNLKDDPRNIVVNQAALSTFHIVLSEKMKSMYSQAKAVKD